jgi:hypothetical protein
MKILVTWILLLTCFSVQADCQDEWLTYQSNTEKLLVYYSKGCYSGDLILSFTKKAAHRGANASEILFETECPTKKHNKMGEVVEFNCRKGGVSPLAGATYRFQRTKTTIKCDGIVSPYEDRAFICTKGCGKTTPQILMVSFGEGCA